ncbi:phosphatase [Micromonospora sp. NBC_01796]|uniref:phosphatase n=1 Tax=Micromonospora sp. NBC_01796 TaxID=2975987 RepID=UPI002DDB4EF2|nr:phosphatase [Micromonospora sp. NBC_01796]WSA85866.1 phosphatase [Micromonospora sp. NBC_01796]
MTDTPSREALLDHLVTTRIAGRVATPRDNNLDHFRRMSKRQPLYLFGLEPVGTWTPAEVLALMVERCGVSPDVGHVRGDDTIDPERTVERLEAMAVLVRDAARQRQRVLVATGHPHGVMSIHRALARALRTAGCSLLSAAAGWAHPDEPSYRSPHRSIRFLDDVAVLTDSSGRPKHTHSPLPMVAILEALETAGQPLPELVIGDHGWAGAAAQAGIATVGFADCNDPALFVGEAEGRVRVCVPLDDNLDPGLYAPLTAYLLHHAGLDG